MVAAWTFSLVGLYFAWCGIMFGKDVLKDRRKPIPIEPEDTIEADFATIYKNDLAEWDRRFNEQTGKIVKQLLNPQEYEREQLLAMKDERIYIAQMQGMMNMSQQNMNRYLGQLGGMATGNTALGNAIGGALGGLLGNGRLQ